MGTRVERVQDWLRDLSSRLVTAPQATPEDHRRLKETADWFDTYDARVEDGSIEVEED